MTAKSRQNDAFLCIKKRFKFNVERVKNLVAIYETLGNDAKHLDVLRAAVVLLHATLEDALRGLLAWKLPHAPVEHLKDIMFDHKDRITKITVAELTKHRALTVEDLIHQAIRSHVAHVTFNNVNDIINHLGPLGLDREWFRKKIGALAPAIERRHRIVHESDRLEPGTDHGRPRMISDEEVKRWTDAVQRFIDDVLLSLEKRPVKQLPKAVG